MRFSSCRLLAFTMVAFSLKGAAEFPENWSWDKKPEYRAKHAAREGKPMPPLVLKDWMNGAITSEQMKGKVVVVDLYATWCGPCMSLIPHNNELFKKYRSQGFVLVGICTSSRGQEKMAQVVKERGIQYPTARDPDLKAEKTWGVCYFPTYALIDRRGIVRSIGLYPGHIEEAVKKLLAESPGGRPSGS